jgi:hypothetical protein
MRQLVTVVVSRLPTAVEASRGCTTIHACAHACTASCQRWQPSSCSWQPDEQLAGVTPLLSLQHPKLKNCLRKTVAGPLAANPRYARVAANSCHHSCTTILYCVLQWFNKAMLLV